MKLAEKKYFLGSSPVHLKLGAGGGQEGLIAPRPPLQWVGLEAL